MADNRKLTAYPYSPQCTGRPGRAQAGTGAGRSLERKEPMKPLILVASLFLLTLAGCGRETVLGPDTDGSRLEPAQKCSVVNGQLC